MVFHKGVALCARTTEVQAKCYASGFSDQQHVEIKNGLWVADEWEQPVEERHGERPTYRPGDIIRTHDGHIGVICEANTTVNGRTNHWNRDEWPEIENGFPPSYSCSFVPGTPSLKSAWWYSSEWSGVKRGICHRLPIEDDTPDPAP